MRSMIIVVLTVLLTVAAADAQFVTTSPSFSLSGELEMGDLVARGGVRYNMSENTISQPYGGLTIFAQFSPWFFASKGLWVEIEGCYDYWRVDNAVVGTIFVGLEYQPVQWKLPLVKKCPDVRGNSTSGMNATFAPSFSVQAWTGGVVVKAGLHVNISVH